MDIIDLTCPKCGGSMHADALLSSAKCEFCGHSMLFSEPQRQALQRRRQAPQKPLTKTDEYRQMLSEEKETNPPSSGNADDEGLGRVLFRLFGFSWRLRQLFSLLTLIATAVATVWIANLLYSAEFKTFYLIAGITATVTGAFCLWVSYRFYRSVPLGVGLGILVSLLMQTIAIR